MPYVSEKIKLPKKYDRRIKLTDAQRAEIRKKYATGLYSQRQLAREYKVSRRLIVFVIDDTKRQRCAEQLKERKKDGRYKPSREDWAATQREHRAYKHYLYKMGLIKLDEETQQKDKNMRTYSIDEIFDAAENKPFGSYELKAKDNAIMAVKSKLDPQIPAELLDEEDVYKYCIKHQVRFYENGDIDYPPPYRKEESNVSKSNNLKAIVKEASIGFCGYAIYISADKGKNYVLSEFYPTRNDGDGNSVISIDFFKSLKQLQIFGYEIHFE